MSQTATTDPTPMRDSSAHLGDAAALRATMDSEGYVYLPGLLPRERVAGLSADVCKVLGEVGWLAPGADPNEARPGPVPHRHDWKDLEWYDGYVAIQRLEGFHTLAHEPALTTAVSALIGDEPLLVHPMKIARITFPGSDFPTPAHQDFFFVPGTPTAFTAWVPLGDYPPHFGGLRVLPGSHRDGEHDHVSQPGAGGHGVDIDLTAPGWVGAEYRMGDVLLFNALTVHHAPINRGDRLRLSADYRYQAVHEPILQACLEPSDRWFANGRFVPDWDELSAGWASRDSIAVPDRITVVADRRLSV